MLYFTNFQVSFGLTNAQSITLRTFYTIMRNLAATQAARSMFLEFLSKQNT